MAETLTIMRMIERNRKLSERPETQSIVQGNFLKLMILMIRVWVCIKRRPKNSTLRNLRPRKLKQKKSQQRLKTRTSNKFNTKNKTLKPRRSKPMTKMKTTQMKRRKRRNSQRPRKDSLEA